MSIWKMGQEMRQPQCSWMRRPWDPWARQERVFVHAKPNQWCFFLSFKIKNYHVIIIYICNIYIYYISHIYIIYIYIIYKVCLRFGKSSVGSPCGRPQRCWAWKLTCWVGPCGAGRFGCSMLASRLWSDDDFRTHEYTWSSSYPKAWRILLYSV